MNSNKDQRETQKGHVTLHKRRADFKIKWEAM